MALFIVFLYPLAEHNVTFYRLCSHEIATKCSCDENGLTNSS